MTLRRLAASVGSLADVVGPDHAAAEQAAAALSADRGARPLEALAEVADALSLLKLKSGGRK
jgi:hypothetical protein